MIGLYTASTLYHSVRTSERGRIALRKYDHASIYFLIAGTYTPICLVPLRGVWGWSIFSVIWILALGGLALSVRWIMAPRALTAVSTCLWLAGPHDDLSPCAVLPAEGFLLFSFLGGVLYTVGGVSYALKWPGRRNTSASAATRFFMSHPAWHIAHFLLMYRLIAYL
jgi:hemolysin III